jgi:hypothetical protein
MAIEYMGQVYGKGNNGTERAKRYVKDFLAKVEPRYSEFFDLFWRSFRNGIVHGSWPQVICLQGSEGDGITVGAGIEDGDQHFDSGDVVLPELIINSSRLFDDLEGSFCGGFRRWILEESDEDVLERAAPRLLRLKKGDKSAVAQIEKVRSWSAGSG